MCCSNARAGEWGAPGSAGPTLKNSCNCAREAAQATQDGRIARGTLLIDASRGSLESGFVADQLADGTRLRAEDVVSVLNRLVAQRRAPRFLFVDKGGGFSGRLLDMWAYRKRPGNSP
jgi:hypothetical protein